MRLTLSEFSRLMREKSFRTQESIEKIAEQIRRLLYQQARKNATTYPKRRTGELYKSIQAFIRPGRSALKIGLTAGNETAFYAGFVEGGTRRMAPRYYLKRANDKIAPKLSDQLKLYLRLYVENPKYYGPGR